ncbi:MAG: hypothetical protein JSR91_09985 [Proteobacteria bacterium]|nr:hypothetical protein [Pseudomonadota bacterium]
MVLVTGGPATCAPATQETIYDQLTAAKRTTARQVEKYFRTIRNELQVLAASEMVVGTMCGFRSAFEELDRSFRSTLCRRPLQTACAAANAASPTALPRSVSPLPISWASPR